jgi:hypothetical protein
LGLLLQQIVVETQQPKQKKNYLNICLVMLFVKKYCKCSILEFAILISFFSILSQLASAQQGSSSWFEETINHPEVGGAQRVVHFPSSFGNVRALIRTSPALLEASARINTTHDIDYENITLTQPIVDTQYQSVVLKAVPYAVPPTNEMRWKPPLSTAIDPRTPVRSKLHFTLV